MSEEELDRPIAELRAGKAVIGGKAQGEFYYGTTRNANNTQFQNIRNVSMVLATVHTGVMIDWMAERIVENYHLIPPEPCRVACNEHVGMWPVGVC